MTFIIKFMTSQTCLLHSRFKQDYIFFLQATLGLFLKLVSKSWCHFVSNLQRNDTISAQFASKISVYRSGLYISVCNSRKNGECFFMFGAILKATNSFFQKGMTFCRSIYVEKIMKLLAFIFEQPSYQESRHSIIKQTRIKNKP